MVHYQETKYGFEYGAADVLRLFSDAAKGWVTIGVKTAKDDLQIYVTKTGKIRVNSQKHGELMPESNGHDVKVLDAETSPDS